MNFLEQAISGIMPSNALPALGERLKKLLGLNEEAAQEQAAPPPRPPEQPVEMPELTTMPNDENLQAGTTRLSGLLKGIGMILQNRNNLKAKKEEMAIRNAERTENRKYAREDLAYKLEQEGKYAEAADQRRADREEQILKMKQELDQKDPMYKAKLQYLNKQIDHYGKGGSGGGGGASNYHIREGKNGEFYAFTKDANGMPVMKRVEEQKGLLQSLMDFFTGGNNNTGKTKNYKPFQDRLKDFETEDGKRTDVIRYNRETGEIEDIFDYDDYKSSRRGDKTEPKKGAEEKPKDGLSILQKKFKKPAPAIREEKPSADPRQEQNYER